MSAPDGPPARNEGDAPARKAPPRVGPRRRRFYGLARLARVPTLATLLPEPAWVRTRLG